MRKHQNFGDSDSGAKGGGQDVKLSSSTANAALKASSANEAAAKKSAGSSPVHVGGSRAGT